MEFEEQNAILQKHVENMKSAISKLEQETDQQQENNGALEKHLVTVLETLWAKYTHLFLCLFT